MLQLLTDEDVHGDIVDGLRRRQPALDVVRVQDVGLRHTPDPDILEWAAQQGRVVVSVDKKTLAVDAWDRPGERVNFKVSSGEYGRINPGRSRLHLLTGPGRLGIEWLEKQTVMP